MDGCSGINICLPLSPITGKCLEALPGRQVLILLLAVTLAILPRS